MYDSRLSALRAHDAMTPIRRRSARRLVASLLCALSLVAPAQANAWQLIARSDDGLIAFYGDGGSVRVRGAKHRVRLLYDYRMEQVDPDTLIGIRSMTALTEVDCRDGTLTGIEGTGYADNMARGKVRWTLRPSGEVSPRSIAAKPGSLDDRIVAYVCSAVARARS
jgi:hypothetical protein